MKNGEKELIGKRVRLIFMDDQFTDLTENSLGTIRGINSLGDILVKWDNGSDLALIPETDQYEVIEEGQQWPTGKKNKMTHLVLFEDFATELADGLEIEVAKPDQETKQIQRHFPRAGVTTEDFEKSEYYSGDPASYNLEWNMFLADMTADQ